MLSAKETDQSNQQIEKSPQLAWSEALQYWDSKPRELAELLVTVYNLRRVTRGEPSKRVQSIYHGAIKSYNQGNFDSAIWILSAALTYFDMSSAEMKREGIHQP